MDRPLVIDSDLGPAPETVATEWLEFCVIVAPEPVAFGHTVCGAVGTFEARA